jgi:hypothetical protein
MCNNLQVKPVTRHNWFLNTLFVRFMACDWTWVMALNQSGASGNNGDELWVGATSMEPPTGVLPHRPRTCYETLETPPMYKYS